MAANGQTCPPKKPKAWKCHNNAQELSGTCRATAWAETAKDEKGMCKEKSVSPITARQTKSLHCYHSWRPRWGTKVQRYSSCNFGGRVRKSSPPTEIRSPDRPVHGESLRRLLCPGPHYYYHNHYYYYCCCCCCIWMSY